MMSRGLDLLFYLSVGMLNRQVIEQKKLRWLASGISPQGKVDKGFIKHLLSE